jgi:predicted nucleotidyltransferase
MPEQLKDVVKTVKSQLAPEYELYLFGSWAKGSATERSDIDLAVHGPAPVPWRQWIVVKRVVDALPTLRKIDLVDLRRVSDDFRKQILTKGKKV